ncbi:MAG: hypothetical protein IJ302_05580, partial [Clostridia bacterium]|nr:hypothetical protein [Clostridia bacterium]
MMIRKTLPALLLLASMLTAASCGSDGASAAESADTAGTGTQAVTETAADTADDRAPLALGEADFGGAELRLLEYDYNTFVRYHDFAYSEESAGELVNDAVFARNSMIEERYNCVISAELAADPIARTRSFVTAGSDD